MSPSRILLALLAACAVASPATAFVATGEKEDRLSHAGPISWYGPLTDPQQGEPAALAWAFLQDHRDELGIPDLAALESTSTRTSLTATHHRWQQTWDGVPVEGSEVSVHILHDGTVWVVHSRTVAHVQHATKDIGLGAAVKAALARVDGTLADAREIVLAVGQEGIPAYEVWVRPTANPYTAWTVRVAQADGRILEAYDLANYARATGNVWTDPIVHSGDADTRSDLLGSDAAKDLSAAYFEVTVENLTSVAGQPVLEGPYVVIREAVRAGGDYKVERADPRFEEFMTYYWIDHAQQRIQALGFVDETGIADYQLDAFPHAQVTIHNAFYLSGIGPYPSGNGMVAFGYRAPCVQAAVRSVGCPAGDAAPGAYPFSDIAEGTDVILHEFGHAVLDHQVPGIRQSADGLGEGWSDYWSKTLIAPLPETHFDDCLGTWFGAHLWPAQDNQTHCIRDLTNSFGDEIADEPIHTAGQIISGALWSIRANTTADPVTGLSGNETANRIFLEGNFLLPKSGTIPKAFEAYLQADLALHGGKHVPLMMQEFDGRNMTKHMQISDAVQQVLDAVPAGAVQEAPSQDASIVAPAVLMLSLVGAVLATRRRRQA